MIDEHAIANRAQAALNGLRSRQPGAAVHAEQVLTHDVTSLINELRYLRRQLAEFTRPTPSALDGHPRFGNDPTAH